MKNIINIISLVMVIALLVACSETEPSGNPSVKVVGQMSDNVASSSTIKQKSPDLQIGTIDSIKIKECRILISRLILHSNTTVGDSAEGDNLIKAGPFLFKLDSTGRSFTIASGTVPAGNYDKIKFELHRFSSSELSQYQNSSEFSDFATSERYSVIIKGEIYESGTIEDFTFNGTVTANLTLNFESVLVLSEGENYTVALNLDPNLVFLSGNIILDPLNFMDSNNIEINIRSAFRAIKK